MKYFVFLFFSLNAFSESNLDPFWLRLCDFGYKQSNLAGWQKQIGDIKYILIKDGVPLIGYSDKGVFFKDKKVCDWREISRSPQDKKKYKQSICPPGIPIEFSELSEDDRKKKEFNKYYSHEEFLIKLEVDDLRIQLDKLDEIQTNEYLISKINFNGDSFELPVSKACETNGDYSNLLIKQLLKNKEFSEIFNDTVNCLQKYPECNDIKQNVHWEVDDKSLGFDDMIVSYFSSLKNTPLDLVSISISEKIEVDYRPRNNGEVAAKFTKEKEMVGKDDKNSGKWKFGNWKLKIVPSHR